MGIFSKKGKPTLTAEEHFASDLNEVVEGASDAEIKEFANWIFEYIPIVISQATRPPSTFLDRAKAVVVKWGKKLVFRNALSPSEGLQKVLKALETHGPAIQRIFVAQAKRYREQQEILRELEATPRRNVIEGVVIETKLLEPVK